MATNYTARPSVTTTYTARPSISGFISYTWGNAPGTWGGVSDTWSTYGTISTGTIYTGRVTI